MRARERRPRGARAGTRLPHAVARRPRARARERRDRRRVVPRSSTTTTPRGPRPTIRALRDGVDAPPEPAPPAPRRAGASRSISRDRGVRDRRRCRARGARSARACPDRPSSGNSQSRRVGAAVAAALGRRSSRSQDAGQRQSRRLRPPARSSPTRTRATATSPTALEQSDAAITIDPNRPEGARQLGRLLYLVSEQVADKDDAGAVRRGGERRVRQGDRGRIRTTPTPTSSGRARVAAIGELARAQVDLQTYLVKAPNGHVAPTTRATLLAAGHDGARNASTTVPTTVQPRLRAEEHPMAEPPAFEIDDDKTYRATITTDRGTMVARPRPEARAEHRQQLRRARAPGLLRRPHVPPGRPRLRDPGRVPARARGTGGPGYKFEDEPVQGRVHARRGRDGELGHEHERLAVLRVHRRLHPQARQGLQPLRLRHRRDGRRAGAPRSAT